MLAALAISVLAVARPLPFELLPDPSGVLTIADLAKGSFEPEAGPVNLGYARGTWWLRVKGPPTEAPGPWLLRIDSARLQEISFFERSPNGAWTELRCGSALPFALRPVLVPRCTFPWAEGGPAYVRVHAEGSVNLGVSAVTADALASDQQADALFVGSYFGIALVMALYNLLLFARLRERSYLWYGLHVGALALNALIVYGYAFQYLWPRATGWDAWSLPLVNDGAVLTGLAFTRSFLDTRRQAPRLDRLFLGGLGLVAGLVLASPLLGLIPAMRLESAAVIGTALLCLSVGGIRAAAGDRPARLFLIAWATFLVAIVVNHLGAIGVLPRNFWTSRAFAIAASLEMVLLALALAARIASLRESKAEADATILLERRLERFFPAKVVRRVLGASHDARLGTQKKRVTLLFSDLQGFTRWTDQTSPDVLAEILNAYLAEMVGIIEREGGTLDKMMGDGIMATFGAADELDAARQARAAMSAAVAMQRRLAELREGWRGRGQAAEMRLRIGVHQDEVTVGNFGTEVLMSFTAIGSGVNLASRLESSCTPGLIQVSEAIRALTPELAYGPAQRKELKGFSAPVTTYELDPASELTGTAGSLPRRDQVGS